MAKKEKVVKEKVEESSNDERILSLLEGMSNDLKLVKEKVKEHDMKFASQEHTAIPKPMDFEPSLDKNVPPDVSQVVREVLGNDVGIEVRTVINDATKKVDQTQLDIIIPEKYHTHGQFNTFHQQREEVTRDESGKIINRQIVPFTIVDRRTMAVRGILSSGGFNDEIRKFTLRIAEQIRGEYEKSKLPPPNFFE